MRTRHLMMLLIASLFQIQFVFSQTNKLYIPPTDCPIGTITHVEMQLDNQSEIVAMQFDLQIPNAVSLAKEGITLKEERKQDHTLTVTFKGENKYQVIVFSGNNKALSANKGAVLNIPLVIPDNKDLIDQEYPFGLTNVVLSERSGKNVMTSFDAGKIKIVDGNGPDITPTQIRLSSDNFQPSGKVSIQWNVQNIGGRATEGGWNEQVYLVDELGNEYYLGRGSCEEILSPQGSVARQGEYNINNCPGIEGKSYAKVVLTSFANWELDAYKENNEQQSESSLDMPKLLIWSMPTTIQEKDSPEVSCTLSRSGSRQKEESFTITNGNIGRLNLPNSVTIKEGEAGVSFTMKVIDNTVANADSFVVVTVSGNGYKETQEVWIEDDEHPYLKMAVDKEEVSEGGTFTITVEREWDIKWPLAVKLSSDHPKRFDNCPKEIVIPANSKTAEVTITVTNDDLPGLDDEVVFTASAPGHVFDLTSKRFIKVLDDDVPNIKLSLSTATASEANQVIVAKLQRTGVTNNKVTVRLSHDGEKRITMPSSIILEAGVSEKEFAITTVDNSMKDGDQTITITGSIYISSCNCSTAGTSAGVFEQKITVLDDDDAAVKSVASKTNLLEGETGKITISVNEVLKEALTIKLSSDNTELQFAQSVTIPAGQSSVEVEITVPKNSTSEGNRIATITMDAGSYGKTTCWLNITDQTLPDAVITALQTDNEITVQNSATVSVTVKNDGSAVLPAQTKVTVYLSTSSSLNTTAMALGSLYTQEELQAGESVTLTKALTFPENAGAYYLIAVVNEEQAKKELSYVNNSATPFALQMKPLYTVQVSLDKTVLKTGESVTITGKVIGGQTANVPVDLYVINSGYRDVVKVTSNSSGIFQTSYTPKNGFYGHFSVGACYPDEGLKDEMAGFDLYGLKRASSDMITWEIFTNETLSKYILLKNPSNKPLSNITAKIISKPENCTINFASITSLAAGSTVELPYDVTGTTVSSGKDWETIEVQLTSAEGAVLDLNIYYYCRSQAAQLEISETNINTTMTIGASREYPITITNTGKGETGEIQVVLPETDWMSLATPAKMPSLKYGESATVLLKLAPDANMEPNVAHKGQFAINCANGKGAQIAFRITPVSSTKGTLVVDVCDEYTYYTAEKPHVSGAQVRVTMPNTNTVVAEGITDENGKFTKELPSGMYTLEVTASKHDSYQNTILVDPEKEREVVVNLSFQTITYSWEVVETEIEDEYEIKTTVKYETNVPAPVVVVDFPDTLAYEDQVFTITATNKGLIAAQNLSIAFPEIPGMQFELLSENSGEMLPAQQSRIFYVKMTINTIQTRGSIIGCIAGAIGLYYTWYCGLEEKLGTAMTDYVWGECGTMGPVFPTPPSKGQSNGYAPGKTIDWEKLVEAYCTSEHIVINRDCSNCRNLFIRKIRDCWIGLFPEPISEVGSVLACVSDAVYDYHHSDKTDEEKKEQFLDDIIKCNPKRPKEGPWEYVKDKCGCLCGLLDPCDYLTPQTRANSANDTYPSYIIAFQDKIRLLYNGFRAYSDIALEIFGNENWFAEFDEYATFTSKLYDFSTTNRISIDNLRPYKPSSVSDQDLNSFVNRWNNTFTSGVENKIDIENLIKLSNDIANYQQAIKENGYTSFGEMLEKEYELLMDNLNESSNSVCSSVSLQFSQSMVMTRQAFRGTLTVNNGHETDAMKNVKLDLTVSDEEGIVATAHEFQINPEKLEGFTGDLEGEWVLNAQESGTATILFIPTKYAAPTEPKEYTFGGTLSYIDPFTNLEVTRDLYPVTLTVNPSPNLTMDYFMQRDILGDDPLTTDVVEPMIPSEFSLLIHNTGYGDATNVRMTTKQPEIVDNEKGLLVDFKIKSSQLNGEDEIPVMGESAYTDFGTIEAGKTAYAQWWLTSTLLGHFTDYKVEASHVTSYDNPDLSLLDEVRIHELIRGIRVDEEATPKVTGFMVNDIPDAEDFPDRMYLTDGTVAPVVKATSAKLTDNGNSNYQLEVTPSEAGWNYINIPDPTGGRLKLISVNENTNLDTRKVWQTDRTLRDGKDPKYEYLIHVVDYFSSSQLRASTTAGSFKLVFEEQPEIPLVVESISGLPEGEGNAASPIQQVTVKFNKAVPAEALTNDMILLYCQGEKIETAGKVTWTKGADEQTYTLDLSAVTTPNGFYNLTILTSEIKDAEGFTGEEDKTVSWMQQLGGKVKLTGTVNPENAGTVSPSSTEVDYNTDVEFKATPATGYTFKNWTIEGTEVSTENPYLHTAMLDQTIVANFNPISYSIEITYDIANGSVSFGTGYYEYNSTLELIATPNSGYVFDGWYIDGKLVSSNERFEYKISGDAKLEARFKVSSSNPDDPNNPTDPDDPNNPSQPSNPGDPDDPNNPDNPDNPDEPTANESLESLVIQVYPTLVTDYVHVDNLPMRSRLLLFNFSGQLVKEVPSCGNNYDLYMGDQSSGFYLLYILTEESHKQTVKLIKK